MYFTWPLRNTERKKNENDVVSSSSHHLSHRHHHSSTRKSRPSIFLFANILWTCDCDPCTDKMEQPIATEVQNDEINALLQSVLSRVHGLKAILISTSDGVPLVQAVDKQAPPATSASLEYLQARCVVFRAATVVVATTSLVYAVLFFE